ncbi:hypothetical protein [Streptomyces sp. SM11]|uniref:hypothetical protein n=1 Tax=Streptomyces sp. SM11 TaxID=565557 RepID=UPI002156611F|nr:hypothetical protein [Streptomyces sp. SM11]
MKGKGTSGYATAFWAASGLLAAAALAAYALLPAERRAGGTGPAAVESVAAEHEGDAAAR